MKKWFTKSLFVGALSILSCCGIGLAQSISSAGESQTNNTDADLPGLRLIAWSALQKPQPVPQQPQPIPGPDSSQPSSQDHNSTQNPNSAQPNPHQSEPDAQQQSSETVSGTVAKVSGKYVLQTSDSLTYQLDDQQTAGQYVGKHVKVTGSVDRATATIRIRSIELLS